MREVTTQYFTATYTGRGEFYSGIRTGERVKLQVSTTRYEYEGEQRKSVSLSIQSLERPGAWLSVYKTAMELNAIEVLTEPTVELWEGFPARKVDPKRLERNARALSLLREAGRGVFDNA